MPGTEDGKGDGQGGKSGNGAGDSITIQIGGEDKQFTTEELATALNKAGELEQTVSGLSGFQKVLTRYGIGAEEYLQNSESALALANVLIEKGVIDQQGNIIEKKAGSEKLPGTGIIPKEGDTGMAKKLGTIEKALLTLGSKMETIEEGQSSLYRRNVAADVKAAHPNLSDSDISKLLAVAARDKSKDFWDHAKSMSDVKTEDTQKQTNAIAKTTIETLIKAGIIKGDKIDMEKFDLNTLKEQDPSGGAPVYEGKKFMFSSRKRRLGKDAKDFTTPSESMEELLDQKLD